MDDASRQTGAGVGFQLRASIGERIEHAIWLGFPASNNETEYEAILVGVNLAKFVSSEKLIIHSDSQLVVRQMNKEYEARDQRMVKYASLVKQQLGSFVAWKLKYILRDSNEKADALATMAASIPIRETTFLPIYYQPASSITTNQVSRIDEESFSWLTPIICYLSSEELSDNRIEAHNIQV